MKMRLISASVAAVIAAWAPPGSARETVNLPVTSVFGGEGQLNGVDTTGAGNLNVGNNQNINSSNNAGGGVTTNADSTANIVFGGGSTVTGFTGASGSRFLSISAGAVGTTVNFGGSVFVVTFNVTGTGTVNFNGSVNPAIVAANTIFAGDGFVSIGSGQVLNSAIVTLTDKTGTLTLNGGSNVSGAVGGGAFGLKLISVAGGNASITGAVLASGFNLGTNTLTLGGQLTTSPGGTIATTLASNTLFGNILLPVGPSLINGGGITVTPTVTGVLTAGTTYRIVGGALAGTNLAPVSVINNNPRFTFIGLPTNAAGDVRIVLAGVAPLATLVTSPAAAAVAPILDIPAAPGSDLLTIQNAIAALPTTAAINNALAQLAPGTTNLAAPWAASQATRNFEDLWMARVDEIQDLCCDACGPNQSGAPVNAHQCKGPEKRSNWWGKAFGSWGRQGDVEQLNGYKTRAAGLMLAYDTPLGSRTRIGLGGGYANTTVDGNNSSGSTKIDSYQVTGYLSHAPGPWFVQGALTAGVDRYDGSRPIVFPGVNRTASADYTGRQYTALVTAGSHFYFNPATVTPLASLQVSRIRVGSYTENGAGDVNLRVNAQDYDIVQSSLGVKAERVIRTAHGTYSPEAHFKWLHDFSSTTMRQEAAFTGGGGTFTVQGVNQDRDLYNVGAGVTYLSCKCDDRTWTVKGLYDYKWNNSSYSSHQLSVIASLKF